jgi:hypothetical protein
MVEATQQIQTRRLNRSQTKWTMVRRPLRYERDNGIMTILNIEWTMKLRSLQILEGQLFSEGTKFSKG